MAMGFTHDIPQEFSDEDRWVIGRVSLSRKSLIVLVAGCGVTYLLFKVTSVIHIPIFGVVLGLLFTVTAVFLTIFPIPESDYLKGGGMTLDTIIIRRLIRYSNRIVYAKGISDLSNKKRRG